MPLHLLWCLLTASTVLLQLSATGLSFYLTRYTKGRWAWYALALAMGLMSGRRIIVLGELLGPNPRTPQFSQELIAFTVSALCAAALWKLRDYLLEHHQNEELVRAQAEQAEVAARLVESELRYRTLFEQSGDYVLVMEPQPDGSLLIVDSNDAASVAHGYSREELVGHPISLLDPHLTPELIRSRMATLERRKSDLLLVQHRRKDGSLFDVEVRTSLFKVGGRTVLLSSERDVTARQAAEESRKQAEDALLRERQRLADILDGTHAGTWSWRVQTGEVEFNERWAEIIGATLKELEPVSIDTWTSHVHPEDLPMAQAALERHWKRESPNFDVEFRQPHRGGGWVWVNARGKVVEWAEDGKPLLMSGTHLDITARKQAQEVVKKSEQKLRIVAEYTYDWEYWIGPEGNLLWMSPSCERVTGYSLDSFQRDPDLINRIILPEDWAVVADHFHNPVGHHDESPIEVRIQHQDGQTIWLNHFCIPVVDERGNPAGRRVNNRDITERKQSEETIRKLSKAIEQSPVSIVITNLQGAIQYVNPKFTEVTGYSLTEAIGQNPRILKSGEKPSEAYKELWDTVLSGETWRGEFHNKRKNGELYWEQASISPIRNEKGDIISIVAVKEDITAQKEAADEKAKLQAQLQQAQKMESLGILAGGIAHDINNVLGAILGLGSAYIGTQPYGSPLHKAHDTICKATARGGQMVKSLLNFARQSPAEIQKLDMNAILKEQVSLLERTTLASVHLKTDLAWDLRPMYGDPNALTNVFINLCVNAVDAMPGNGTLALYTRNVDNNWIEVVVEDTGTGMPKEVLEKALDPFFTTKETGKGTGLGLSMAFNIVKAHQGQMAIESEPGHGTRVMLRFPACEQEDPTHAAAPAGTAATLTPHRTLKVLLVDDDELIQSSLQAILEVLGHSVVSIAHSGEGALVMLEGGLEPDLVILDMNMPGLGGVGTLPRLRGLCPSLPVLLATGRVDQTAMTLASAHPGVTLLPKPFGLRELQRCLESIGLG